MTMEQALSGLSQSLFYMVVALVLVAIAVLVLEGLTLVFLNAARLLLVKLRGTWPHSITS